MSIHTNCNIYYYTRNIYSVMATHRRKIARSAVRRVKRRNTKNTKLRTLRSRKNTTEKKARLNMREMKGGAVNFRMFEVHFGKMNGDLKTNPESRNSQTLLGTLCYYPEDGDFYFCIYDSAIPHINFESILYAIYKLCGIAPDSEPGKALSARFGIERRQGSSPNTIINVIKDMSRDEKHPFHYFNFVVFGGLRGFKGLKYADGKILTAADEDDYDEWKSTEGVQPIRACFVLKNRGKLLSPNLSFITYTRIEGGEITQDYKNVSICTIPKMPDKLPEDVVIELPSERNKTDTLGLVLVDLETQDESLDSRRTYRFADYSLPVNAAMNARKDIIDPHLGPDPPDASVP